MQNCDEMEKQCFDYETKTCPCVAAAGAELAGAGAPRVVLNGLAPTVAGAPGWRRTDGCFWFTTFRDPTARMVSAMFYCRKQSADPLCGGKSAAWFESATAAQMAKLWGNYGLTNLLLSAPLRPDVRYGNASGTRVGDRAWQRWRGDLRGGDDPSTAAGARNVALVVGALPALYDALVVVERMDASLDVLDCVLPLSGGKTWKALTTTTRASHGSETYAADERRAAAAARRDPDVVRALAGDRRIYDAALARFDEIRLELAPRCPRLASASSPPAAMKATPSAAADLPHTAKRSTDGRGRTAAVVVVGEAFRRHRERPMPVGAADGAPVGAPVGAAVGAAVGAGEFVGAAVGAQLPPWPALKKEMMIGLVAEPGLPFAVNTVASSSSSTVAATLVAEYISPLSAQKK